MADPKFTKGLTDPVGPPPKEALEYFAGKGLKVGFNWFEVWQAEHAAAFTIAKVTEKDVLADMRVAVQAAMKEGRTFREFAKVAAEVLDRSGWSAARPGVSTLYRLKIIYDTNLRMARAAGQWKRIERTKEIMPNLEYNLGPSRVHREEHMEWDGLILPVDDPFWETHMPPNGFG